MTPAAASPISLDDPRVLAAESERDNVRSRTQAFFAGLSAETRKPHFGDQARELYRALLLRATEAGLYDPDASFL